MAKTSLRNLFLAITALIITALSCNQPNRQSGTPGLSTEPGDLGNTTGEQSDSCDASRFVQVSSQITRQETNQYGTRSCEYVLTIKNTSDFYNVWVYFYQHDKDGYQHTEKSRWMGQTQIRPGDETEWRGQISIYDDKDADGPLMSIPEKLAVVDESPSCAASRKNMDFLDTIAIPLTPVCPLE